MSQVVTRRSGPTQQATCLCLSTFFENNIFCECFYASGYFFFFVNREKKVFIFRKFWDSSGVRIVKELVWRVVTLERRICRWRQEWGRHTWSPFTWRLPAFKALLSALMKRKLPFWCTSSSTLFKIRYRCYALSFTFPWEMLGLVFSVLMYGKTFVPLRGDSNASCVTEKIFHMISCRISCVCICQNSYDYKNETEDKNSRYHIYIVGLTILHQSFTSGKICIARKILPWHLRISYTIYSVL